MAQTTFANSRGIVHTKSGGMSAVFPDVCRLGDTLFHNQKNTFG